MGLFDTAPGIHRQQQRRHVNLRAVRLDLPPDVAAAVGLISKKTGICPAELIIDILRDNLGSATFAQLDIPQMEAAE
jgi:hypothetical protein